VLQWRFPAAAKISGLHIGERIILAMLAGAVEVGEIL
jgi:hypothetical protein